MSAPRTFGDDIGRFLTTLRWSVELPPEFTLLDPYASAEVRRVVTEFCRRFYTGTHLRLGMWGINPGRLGAGLTGLCFTDPVSLRDQLGIASTIDGRREPSATFVGMVIEAYGGPEAFYHDVYLGAISPLGFVRQGSNVNFYDDPTLSRAIVPFVQSCLETQMAAGLRSRPSVLLGSGALRQFVERTLQPRGLLDGAVVLEHPRFIMQYRRRHVDDYVRRYVDTIRDCLAR